MCTVNKWIRNIFALIGWAALSYSIFWYGTFKGTQNAFNQVYVVCNQGGTFNFGKSKQFICKPIYTTGLDKAQSFKSEVNI